MNAIQSIRTSDPKKRALITGSTGFIGSNLLRRLSEGGWEVHVLTRRPQSSTNSHFYTGQMDQVTEAVASSKPDVVFHVASLFLAQHSINQITPLIESNVLLGTQLLEAMCSQGSSRFVNTGTSWQYFEGDVYSPVNLYAATKQAFEDILVYYSAVKGIKAITINLFDSYGSGDERKKLLHLLLNSLKSGVPLEMSPGEQMLDMVHVDDICNAFLHAATSLDDAFYPGHRSFGVSSGHPRQLRDLVKTLEDIVGRKLNVIWGARPYRDREVMRLWKGPQLPGWQPQISLEEGFRSLFARFSEDAV